MAAAHEGDRQSIPSTRVTGSPDAIVTPELLVWARKVTGLPIDAAAAKARVSRSKLEAWETGTARPTVRIARLLAKTYRVPFAAFYLPAIPMEVTRMPHDYRRHVGTSEMGPSIEIIQDIRESWAARELLLELMVQAHEATPKFQVRLSLRTTPELAGARLRDALQFDVRAQLRIRNARITFNRWRECVEAIDALVFQTPRIKERAARAYSLSADRLPVIVVNRKEPYSARSFSLLHELAHVALRNSGLCDLRIDHGRPPEDQRIEVFCNAVAAACLMPAEAVLSHQIVWHHTRGTDWEENRIGELAVDFGVSREAMLRRLLTLDLTTEAFYQLKRTQYAAEYLSRPRRSGPISPATSVLSIRGRPFVRTVLASLGAKRITSTDAAQYLGLRARHIDRLATIAAEK